MVQTKDEPDGQDNEAAYLDAYVDRAALDLAAELMRFGLLKQAHHLA
jgi:hypothetical protein